MRPEGRIALAAPVKAARRAGASRGEKPETIAMAICLGGGPSMACGSEALQAFDQFDAAAAA